MRKGGIAGIQAALEQQQMAALRQAKHLTYFSAPGSLNAYASSLGLFSAGVFTYYAGSYFGDSASPVRTPAGNNAGYIKYARKYINGGSLQEQNAAYGLRQQNEPITPAARPGDAQAGRRVYPDEMRVEAAGASERRAKVEGMLGSLI